MKNRKDFAGIVLAFFALIISTSCVRGQIAVMGNAPDINGYIHYTEAPYGGTFLFKSTYEDVQKIEKLKYTSYINVYDMYAVSVDSAHMVVSEMLPVSFHFFYLPNENRFSKEAQRFLLINVDNQDDDEMLPARLYWITDIRSVEHREASSFTVRYTLEDRDNRDHISCANALIQNSQLVLYIIYEGLVPIAVTLAETKTLFDRDSHNIRNQQISTTWIDPMVIDIQR